MLSKPQICLKVHQPCRGVRCLNVFGFNLGEDVEYLFRGANDVIWFLERVLRHFGTARRPVEPDAYETECVGPPDVTF